MQLGVVTDINNGTANLAMRMFRSFRDRVTDIDKTLVCAVVEDDVTLDYVRQLMHTYVPGIEVRLCTLPWLLRALRIEATDDVIHNTARGAHWGWNISTVKCLSAMAYLRQTGATDMLLVNPDLYVFRECSFAEHMIKPYKELPVHFSYISGNPWLHELTSGASHVLGYNNGTLSAFNNEHPNWIFEGEFFDRFLVHLSETHGVSNFYDALRRTLFTPGTNRACFSQMAYRYYLEQQQLMGDDKLQNYLFLDTFDALAQHVPAASFAATRPTEHPIERLGAWLRPTNYEAIREFINSWQLTMLRMERNYANPWLVQHLIRNTETIKIFAGDADCNLYL